MCSFHLSVGLNILIGFCAKGVVVLGMSFVRMVNLVRTIKKDQFIS